MEEKCPLCRGTGWIVRMRDGLEFAKRCQCVEQKRKGDLIQQARIPKRYAECSFKNFKLENWPDKSIQKAKREVEYFVQAYPAVESGILIMGPPGTGKTHLAVAAIKSLMEQKRREVYIL